MVVEEKTERNEEIYHRRMAGEMPTALGKVYGISANRVYQIVRAQQKKREKTK